MCDLVSLMAAIEAHLASHPQAADSAEGVALWWLGGVAASVQEVERALLGLAHRGRVRCVRLADGAILYSRAGARGDGRHVARCS